MLDDPLITATGLLFESAAALQRRLDDDLQATAGIPMTTYEVLIRLARSPDERLAHSELSRQLSLTSGGITRLIDRLERDELVRRERDTTDRRVYRVALTETGRRTLMAALPHHLQTLERLVVTPLGPDGSATLDAALRPLRDALMKDPRRSRGNRR